MLKHKAKELQLLNFGHFVMLFRERGTDNKRLLETSVWKEKQKSLIDLMKRIAGFAWVRVMNRQNWRHLREAYVKTMHDHRGLMK